MTHTMIPKRAADEAARPRFELLIDEAFVAIANPAFAAVVSVSYAEDRWACERLYLVGACGWTPEELDEIEDLILAGRLTPDGRVRDACPGCGEPLSVSTAKESEDAYAADAVRCHACVAQARAGRTVDDPTGLLVQFSRRPAPKE